MSLADRLEKCYTGAVYDALHTMGHAPTGLPPDIRPLDPSYKLAGRVYVASGHVDHALDDHETLLRWTAFLSKAPADSVVICQPNDSTLAHMGELSAETLQRRGVRGYIVDGGCRDSEFILSTGFKVFCRYLTPVDIVGRWIVDDLGAPISIGEVDIKTGDYVLGDRDGVLIIPAENAEEVVARTEEVTRNESLVRKAIRQEVDPQEAYLKYGKF